jgi:hypothetical protein
MATAQDVQRAIAASFPEGDRAAASDALARLDSTILEGPRVQLAILVLAQLFGADQRARLRGAVRGGCQQRFSQCVIGSGIPS